MKFSNYNIPCQSRGSAVESPSSDHSPSEFLSEFDSFSKSLLLRLHGGDEPSTFGGNSWKTGKCALFPSSMAVVVS